MKLASVLIVSSFVSAWFASTVPHDSLPWVLLTLLSVALFMASLFRVHAVINMPRKEDES